jgi:signal transduction histidine kinase
VDRARRFREPGHIPDRAFLKISILDEGGGFGRRPAGEIMRAILRRFGPAARLIAAFVALAAALFALTLGDVRGIRENGSNVQVAGKLRLDAQRTLRWLAEAGAADPAAAAAARVELARHAASVAQLIEVLAEGGEAQIAPGNVVRVRVEALTPQTRDAARGLREAWAPIAAALAPVAGGGADAEALRAAARAVAGAEQRFNGMTSALLGAIGADSLAMANRLRLVGGAGALAAVGFFLLLVWLYSRELRRVQAAQRETDEILAAVPAGLFLLDREGRIGANHSARLGALLQQSSLGGRDFFALLAPMVAPKTVQTARDFVELLFGDRVHEELVAQLNPLDQVEVLLPGESGRMENRFLGFGFRRVRHAGRTEALMVTITDVSDRVRLARELDVAAGERDAQLERLLDLLATLLRLEPGSVQDRLARWQALVEDANGALKRSARGNVGLRETVNAVFRPIHTLKSEAAALQLGMVAQRAAAVEKELADLRTRPELAGSDFLPVTVRLDELYAQFDAIRRVLGRLPAAPRAAAAVLPPVAEGDRFALLDRVCQQVAAELGKQAILRREGLDDATVPAALREPVLEIATQLLRNALAHGIEPPSARVQRHKAPRGTVRMAFERAGDGWDLVVHDDGAGIDFEAVRRRAVESGRRGADEAATMDARALAALLFEPGFSTASAGEAAGRGVGLDLVRHAAARAGGRVSLSTMPGRHALFRVHFPDASASSVRAA